MSDPATARTPDHPLFALRDRLSGAAGMVEIGFTGLGWDVGDATTGERRAATIEALASTTGCRPVLMHQVHGADVQVVEEWEQPTGRPRVDALVTGRPGFALLTRAADCVPVLLGDADTGLIAAVHAGRQGVARGVVSAAVARLGGLGAGRLTAWVGPHVCGRCYEVPEELREEVATMEPATWSVTSWDTPALDLGAGVRAQLDRTGVTDVRAVGECTLEERRWPSHRRGDEQGARFAGVVWRA